MMILRRHELQGLVDIHWGYFHNMPSDKVDDDRTGWQTTDTSGLLKKSKRRAEEGSPISLQIPLSCFKEGSAKERRSLGIFLICNRLSGIEVEVLLSVDQGTASRWKNRGKNLRKKLNKEHKKLSETKRKVLNEELSETKRKELNEERKKLSKKRKNSENNLKAYEASVKDAKTFISAILNTNGYSNEYIQDEVGIDATTLKNYRDSEAWEYASRIWRSRKQQSAQRGVSLTSMSGNDRPSR